MSDKKKYEVLQPIDYNNKRFEPGKEITLDDETAGPLLAANGIKPLEEKKLEEDGDKKTKK